MKWISVDDMLPEDGERVVTIGKPSYETNYLVTTEIHFLLKVGFISNITHWTSLELPEENK